MKRKKRPPGLHLYLAGTLLIAAVAVLMIVTEKERRIVRELASPPSRGSRVERGSPPPGDTAPPRGEKPRAEETAREPDRTDGRGVPQKGVSEDGRGDPGSLAPGVRDPKSGGRARYKIAVIIDDVGYPSDDLEAFAAFGGKLTFSVLPHLPSSTRHAEFLHASGFEVLVHIPMEPDNYPSVNPGPKALLGSDTERAVRGKIAGMIRDVPYAVGANNHMGSRATRECDLMEWTMGELKAHDLFFVDSLTTPDSCARDLAVKLGVPASRRDVFLDNTDSYQAVEAQFERLKRIAKSTGTAIGIGHVHKVHTLRVLQAQLPRLPAEGFSLVFVSEAVRDGASRR